ncbi:MAG TPA: hypothetical protein VGM51_18240 [Armatimonadota bacterium]
MNSANTHIHLPPNFSAFESVEQAVALACDEEVGILGASNYYDFTVYSEFGTLCHQHSITPLFGMEIVLGLPELADRGVRVNDPGNPGKMYLCGKALSRWKTPTAEADRLLNTIRHNDSARMAEMVDRMAEIFAEAGVETRLDARRIVNSIVLRYGCAQETVYLQERHVAQAFQEALFQMVRQGERVQALSAILKAPVSADDEARTQAQIRNRLMKAGKPAFVEETFIGLEDGLRLISELGGIPCYPVLADGADVACEYEADVNALIEKLLALGIRHAEFIPNRNSPETLRAYVLPMRDAGLSVSAGTEHNTLDLLPMTPTCMDGEPIPDDVQAVFAQGARDLVEAQQ